MNSFRKVCSFGEIRTYLSPLKPQTIARIQSHSLGKHSFIVYGAVEKYLWIRSLICSITASHSHSHSINHSNRRTMKTTTMTKEKMIFNSFFKQQPGENKSSVFLHSYEFNAYSYRVVLMWLFLQFWEDAEIRSWIDWIVIV